MSSFKFGGAYNYVQLLCPPGRLDNKSWFYEPLVPPKEPGALTCRKMVSATFPGGGVSVVFQWSERLSMWMQASRALVTYDLRNDVENPIARKACELDARFSKVNPTETELNMATVIDPYIATVKKELAKLEKMREECLARRGIKGAYS